VIKNLHPHSIEQSSFDVSPIDIKDLANQRTMDNNQVGVFNYQVYSSNANKLNEKMTTFDKI